MDRGVGRIVDQLKESGVFDDTLILFLADNGGCAEEIAPQLDRALHIPEATRDGRPVAIGNDPELMPGPETTYQSYGLPWANASNTPFRLYKHWVHEGGISSPLIAHWPAGIPDDPRRHPDRRPGPPDRPDGHLRRPRRGRPTRAEHAGHAITPLEGKPRAVLQTGVSRGPRGPLLGARGQPRRPPRQVEARQPLPASPWELYDMDADRTEQHDLADRSPRPRRRTGVPPRCLGRPRRRRPLGRTDPSSRLSRGKEIVSCRVQSQWPPHLS